VKAAAIVIGVIAFFALMIWAITSENPWLAGLAALVFLAGIAAGAIASKDMREDLGDRFGPLTWIARGAFHFSGRRIAISVAAIAAALGLAEWIERATRPAGRLAEHVERMAPRIGEYAPIAAAAELEREFPAEDQRYTPWGVFLRYEDDVVALLPRTVGTSVERLPDDEAYVRYGAILGRFWGPAYHATPSLRPSALSVPDDVDLRAAARALAAAERAHDACYGWDVEIRSGEREGHLYGSGEGVGTRIDVKRCERSAVLAGWIDPRAGRYRRGSPGDWSLGVSARFVDDFPDASWEALSIPYVELLEGSTTEPSDGGAIAGKGLLEYIGALPLLAQEADALPAVELPEPRRPRGELAEVERSDAERRQEESGAGTVPAFLRVGAGFAIFVLLMGLLAGLIARAVRLIR
jgi:HAMP domain-containing protein